MRFAIEQRGRDWVVTERGLTVSTLPTVEEAARALQWILDNANWRLCAWCGTPMVGVVDDAPVTLQISAGADGDFRVLLVDGAEVHRCRIPLRVSA